MSVRKGNDVLAGSAPIKIDSVLNANSANPVQNKTITQEVVAIKQDIEVLSGNIDCGTM